MRKFILLMLLAAVSSSAMAEWAAVDAASDGTFTIYTDLATMRKAGNRVKMWGLIDYKTARNVFTNGMPYMSIKEQEEYDCKEEQTRTLYADFKSGNMGAGEVVHIDSNPGKWAPIEPGSTIESLWKIACGKQ